jgi:heme-degrading monooxygenase HmoA
VIARIWRGQATAKNAAAYQRHVTETVFPLLVTMRGHCGAHLLTRTLGDQVEFLAVTFWNCLDDIKQFAGDNIEAANVEPHAKSILSDYDTFARHFEVAHALGDVSSPDGLVAGKRDHLPS